ncbi:hypothetical protein A4X09_0g7611 [Tilletia walkeri]|uniref:Uncharacterized protein n=1 Tax=Tilletia walkeri TaxID=117179 RepID=A0A8X7N1K6_9BASI|nr:hypothetical protein A4X09_0g7611 [Tilletia walkeri]
MSASRAEYPVGRKVVGGSGHIDRVSSSFSDRTGSQSVLGPVRSGRGQRTNAPCRRNLCLPFLHGTDELEEGREILADGRIPVSSSDIEDVCLRGKVLVDRGGFETIAVRRRPRGPQADVENGRERSSFELIEGLGDVEAKFLKQSLDPLSLDKPDRGYL